MKKNPEKWQEYFGDIEMTVEQYFHENYDSERRNGDECYLNLVRDFGLYEDAPLEDE